MTSSYNIANAIVSIITNTNVGVNISCRVNSIAIIIINVIVDTIINNNVIAIVNNNMTIIINSNTTGE